MSISRRATAGVAHNRPKAKCCAVCGTPYGDDGRSVPHLRRFFAMLRRVYENWPESHDRQFASADEMRAFLLIKAKHRVLSASIPLQGVNKDRAMMLVEAAFRAAGSYAFATPHGGNIVIFKPKSIAFAKLSHLQAVGIFQDVEDVIKAETGIDTALLMQPEQDAVA